MMRKILTTILVVGLVLGTLGGLPALGDEEETTEPIGRYERITGSGDLTENHVAPTASGLEIEGPSFTDTLRVDRSFLEAELGSWSASKSFSIDGDHAVFDGRMANFEPLNLGSDPVFTLGSRGQVEFQDRPMWTSVDQDEYGGKITLDMDDGDTTGQSVFIGKEWLWERGIHRPEVVHEDGTSLSVERALGGDGWMIEMHHFTYVEITATDMVVFSRQDGVIAPHTDETRWYPDDKRLEIDVGHECGSHVMDCSSIDQDVLVDQDWLDMKIDHLALEEHVWEMTEWNDEMYYEVSLTPSQTPTTLVYEKFIFEEGSDWLYTGGSPENVYLFDLPQLMKINTIEHGLIELELGEGVGSELNSTANIALKTAMLLDLGIDAPAAHNSAKGNLTVGVTDGFVQIHGGEGSFTITQNSVSVLNLLDEECAEEQDLGLSDPKEEFSWDGDDGHEGAWANMNIMAAGIFCFEWDLVAANDFSTAFWVSYMNVFDQDNPEISCDFGNYGQGGGMTLKEEASR